MAGHQAAVCVLFVAATGQGGLPITVHMVRRFHVINQRQVQHIQPDDRVCTVMAVLMPQACGRENQISSAHRAFLAVHRGVSALAFDNHAHCIWRVSMARCPLAGHKQLHAQIHGGAGLHFVQTVAGVGQHQHAAFGFFNRCEFASFQQQRLQSFVRPMRRLCLARGNFGWQYAAQTRPQRHQVQVAQILHVVRR